MKRSIKIMSCIFIVIVGVFILSSCKVAEEIINQDSGVKSDSAEVSKVEDESESIVAGSDDITQGMDKKLKLAMVAHNTSSPFSAFFKAGGDDAAAAHNIDFTYMGTPDINIPEQVSLFENTIQGGFDGIAVTIFDQKAFEKAIEDANSKSIAVISFNIDGDWGSRATLGYAGADEFKLGYAMGKWFFENAMKGQGKYILCPAIADLGVLVYRMDGVKEAAKEYPDIELVTTVEIGTDLSKAYANVENAVTANPDVNGLIGTDNFSESIGQYISKTGNTGKIMGACVDPTPGILKYLKEGAIQIVVGQNPYLQGYYAIDQLWLYLAKGYHPLEIDTGVEVVTQENMGPYLEYFGIK